MKGNYKKLIFLMLIFATFALFALSASSVGASSTCGNGIINSGEQCELPLTKNNNYCLQSNHECSGKFYGSRDSYGNCSSGCQCVYDSFSYACSAGHCGAECGVDSDCNDFNSNTLDKCDLSTCSCKHTTVQSCSGSDSYLLTRFSPSSCTNSSGTFSSYCSGNSVVLFGCNSGLNNCVSVTYDCSPYNATCSSGYCSACKSGYEWVDPSNHVKGCKPVSACGNGIINTGEQCESPVTFNNNYCLQSNHQCSGKLYGSRDSYGNCNSACGCSYDSFSYSCSVGNCGAECDSTHACPMTNCDYKDGCVGNDYYDYVDVFNSCSSGCECSHTACGSPTIYYNDVRCVYYECYIDSDCDRLDSTYCSGDSVFHVEGKCVNHVCVSASASLMQNCNSLDRNFCEGSILKKQDGYCSAGLCYSSITTIRNCNDGLFCNGVESCSAGSCVSGTLVDCSAFNIAGVSTCFNYPDGNSKTWDYRSSFISSCSEATDSCTAGSSFISSACSISSCSAECDSSHSCPATQCNYLDGCRGNDYYDYSNVLNSCTSSCTCTANSCSNPTIYHNDARCVPQPTCGNGVINFGEQCELPNTVNNNYCLQSNHQCLGKLYGSRDSYGNCNSACGCSYDSFSYSCSVGNCGAECDSSHLCAATECDYLDSCVGRDYYDYSDVANSCTGSCTCTNSACGAPVVIRNDSRCGECSVNSDCSNLDYNFCSGSSVFHSSGVCISNRCASGTPVLVKNCNDGLFCNGVESCSAGSCVAGTPVDCSAFNIAGVSICNNNPDGNPLTWDYRSSFISSCSEATDSCTQGSLAVTSTCDKSRCGASCTIGEIDNRSCGLGGYQIRACTASCSWSEWSNCTDEGECAVGTVENKTCGNCGTSQRICKSDYQWGNWSACSNQGVCAAGSIAAERCGFMLTGTKTRSCSDSCSWQLWGNCTGEGECYPGETQERDCTINGYSGKDERTCMSNFKWGLWTGCTLPETQINIDSLRIINDDCVQPGGELMASLQVGYYSYKDGSITITAVIPDLGLRSRIGPIDVNSRDDISQLLIMRIPDDTPEGTYDVRFTINDDYRRVKYREVTVSKSCGRCPDYCKV